MIKINMQGIKDNAQHIAGLIIGTVSKGVHDKSQRGTTWYSTVAATLALQGVYQWFPYKMIIKK